MKNLYFLFIFVIFCLFGAASCSVSSQPATSGASTRPATSPAVAANPSAATATDGAKEDSGAKAAPAAAELKTVTDYYLALPDDAFALDDSGRTIKDKAALLKYRRSLIKIEDIKNGYLKLEGNWEGWGEVAIFKRDAGGYLVAHTTVGCGPVCASELKLLTYSDGKWTDVTDQYAPKITGRMILDGFAANGGFNEELKSGDDLPYYFLLPREGRVLKVACNECTSDNPDDFVLLKYEWNGDKFVKR